MPRVRFTDTFEHPISSNEVKEWPAGWSGEVDDALARKAVRDNKAVVIDAPESEAAPAATVADEPKGKGRKKVA